MNSMIYNPLEEYAGKFKNLHLENTNAFLDDLVKRSGVNIDENRETVRLYNEYTENFKKLKRKLNLFRFLRVIMIITLVLIPLVIWKTTPKIRALREEVENAKSKAEELLALAEAQMRPLNNLFSDRDALDIIEKTVPLLSFDNYFTVKQEVDMKINYDFDESRNFEESTLDALAGHYNDNPFLFENRLVHRMGTQIYHGYKTIYWTETYRDSNGKLQRRTRSQTLHASVTKPKPFYSTQVVLNYCAQGGPDLTFTRDATSLHERSEKEIERYVKRGEKKLKRKTDKAIKGGGDFTSMSNTDFEVLFDALDRNNEVQFRTLFTPLAQTNMVSLIRSKAGYGDDFSFFKRNRTNKIITTHSQGRAINLLPSAYVSYSFDIIKETFTSKNTEYFKAVYFDMAPVLAIPIYQERPVHSLKPIPDYSQLYSLKESEALANMVDKGLVVHPRTKTEAIIKSSFVTSASGVDKTDITAYSYDIENRIDVIPVYGGDGKFHNVPVHWEEYIPIEKTSAFSVADIEKVSGENIIAQRNGLCIFKS
ncbi:MAG: hypothetical protein IIX18_04585 [Clostridia bacterium]|nr:hypothetical protein [Clostridia bacterium]